MPSAGITVHPDCVARFNDLKMVGKGSGLTYVIYKISDDGKEIVVDETGDEKEYDVFRNKLKGKADPKVSGKTRPSYAVYDIRFEVEGEGPRTKLAFISYIPMSTTAIRTRMVYASSREGIKNALTGIGMEHQADDDESIEWNTLLTLAAKGKKVVG